ncbi:MAG TPA: hypothetical protein VFF82_08220 [Rhodocyclaceae bacterium]|nr:hypothetical protein [Rhodocyclaceae bacterium]
MISLNECIGMSGLQEEEVAVVAEHEHLPLMVAAELAQTLLETPRGLYSLHVMFRDRLAALATGRERVKEHQLAALYAQFRIRHPLPRIL